MLFSSSGDSVRGQTSAALLQNACTVSNFEADLLALLALRRDGAGGADFDCTVLGFAATESMHKKEAMRFFTFPKCLSRDSR
jgi:hypothetical protein